MNNSIAASEVIDDGEYQIVNLPEGFQFVAEEVYVQKIGDSVVLRPISQTEILKSIVIK